MKLFSQQGELQYSPCTCMLAIYRQHIKSCGWKYFGYTMELLVIVGCFHYAKFIGHKQVCCCVMSLKESIAITFMYKHMYVSIVPTQGKHFYRTLSSKCGYSLPFPSSIIYLSARSCLYSSYRDLYASSIELVILPDDNDQPPSP